VLLGTLAVWQTSAHGQQAPAPAAGRCSAAVPRTADGHPDLQGTYDLATMTQVERRRPTTDASQFRSRRRVASRPLRQRGPPRARSGQRQPFGAPVGGDGSTGAAGGVGGYNSVLDRRRRGVHHHRRPGAHVDRRGSGRTAVSAADSRGSRSGRRPRGISQRPTRRRRRGDVGLETAPARTTIPSGVRSAERCLLGFGSTSGPPALPNYFYNNLHQIVQTRTP
jgi:hypothetical protein